MPEPIAQMDQGDEQTVGEDLVALQVDTGLPLPLGTAPPIKLRLAPGEPPIGQLCHQIAEM
ncbi:hypothetical protein ACFRSX_08525 [Streptomyces goshikiensis]|uniref:hypothetical protein n=1 Tax=Streptomyces goshikiensis TaxID=1942 RepID=UPI000C27E60E|nr:hypothetical protein CG724_12485 [Streptomyces sp. CB02120-2]